MYPLELFEVQKFNIPVWFREIKTPERGIKT